LIDVPSKSAAVICFDAACQQPLVGPFTAQRNVSFHLCLQKLELGDVEQKFSEYNYV
jgi:hypothetical protein